MFKVPYVQKIFSTAYSATAAFIRLGLASSLPFTSFRNLWLVDNLQHTNLILD